MQGPLEQRHGPTSFLLPLLLSLVGDFFFYDFSGQPVVSLLCLEMVDD